MKDVTDIQTNITKTEYFRWWNVFDDTCRIILVLV